MRKTAVSFAIVAGICLALTAYIGGQITHFSLDERYTLKATFEDVNGLRAGNNVRLAGVPVGLVSSVKLIEGKAVVKFTVEKSVALPDDSTVAVRWLNLLGQRELYLYPGASKTMLATNGKAEMTRTKKVVDFGRLINQLGPLTQALNPNQINSLVQALVDALNNNVGNVDSIVADLNSVLGTLASRNQTLQQLLTDYGTLTAAVSHRDLQIQTAIDNLVLLSQTFQQNDQVLDDALVELPKLTSNLDALLDTSAGNLGSILNSLSVVTGVTHDRVGDLEALLKQLPATLQTLFDVTNDGNFINVNAVCISPTKPPCPHPIVLANQKAGVGAVQSADTFQALLVGGGPGRAGT